MKTEYFEKIKKLHNYIITKKVATPHELASCLNVSKRTCFDMIDYLKSIGASISYNRKEQCYYYNNDFHLIIEIKVVAISDGEMKTIVGGSQKNGIFLNSLEKISLLQGFCTERN
ncbi:MAG: hypothetical protein Q4G08_03465 [Capnocytophaga sp.]|nr:hypothetical protein [Capnocytophaga sp.]